MTLSKWDKYQDACLSTAVYPRQVGLVYTVLGFVGEVGELIELVRGGEFTPDQIKGELGDAAYYLAMATYELKLPFSIIADKSSASAGLGKPAELLPSLFVAASALAQSCKRIMRDDNFVVSIDRANIMIDQLGDALTLLRVLSKGYGLVFDEVLKYNSSKLAQRKEAGALHGAGETIEDRKKDEQPRRKTMVVGRIEREEDRVLLYESAEPEEHVLGEFHVIAGVGWKGNLGDEVEYSDEGPNYGFALITHYK